MRLLICVLAFVQDGAGLDLDDFNFLNDRLDGEQLSCEPAQLPPSAGVTAATSMLSLCRNTRHLVGREQQVTAVQKSLQQRGAAVIWGSPGEGKTAVAAEAGCRLQEDAGACIRLSVVLDMKGAHTFVDDYR